MRSLSVDDGELLYDSPNMQVRQLHHLRWLHFHSNAVQALVDLRRPSLPRLPYARGMCFSALFKGEGAGLMAYENVLNLGSGAATMERFWSAYFPASGWQGCDASAEVVDVAQRFFLLPADRLPLLGDAQRVDQLLAEHAPKAKFDLILNDLFDARQHPTFYYQTDYYNRLSALLKPAGILVFNLLPQNSADLLKLLLPLRRHFPQVMALEFPQHRNVILYASRSVFPEPRVLAERAMQFKRSTKIDFNDCVEGLFAFPPVY